MTSTAKKRSYFILTALGSDRPGIVADVTGFLHELGCNIEESRMAVLGGEFGLLILASSRQGEFAGIEQRLHSLAENSALELRLKSTMAPTEHRTSDSIPFFIKTYAMDREGIVRSISQALAALGVNIVSATTSSYPAPVSGTPLFQMEMEVDVPRNMEISSLRKELDSVAADQNADIEVSFQDGVR